MTTARARDQRRIWNGCISLLSAFLFLHVKPIPAIDKVYPDTERIGGKVTIVTSVAVENATVYFGGRKADVESAAGKVLYVIVPEGLTPGETPPITVRTALGPITYLGFTVAKPVLSTAAPPPLSIEKITPANVASGEEVWVSLSRPPDTQAGVSLYLGELKIASVPHGQRLVARIPDDAPAGVASLAVVEGSVATPPSAFTIVPRTTLGIPQSWLLPGVGILLTVLILGVFGYRAWQTRRRYARLTRQYDVIRSGYESRLSDPVDEAADAFVETAELPVELAEICASGNCLLFAGPGLAAQARLPTRYETLSYLIRNADLDDTVRQQLLDASERDQLGFVSEVLGSTIPRETLIAELQNLFAGDDTELSEAHELLRKIPFAAALTTGWDGLIEKTFEDRRPIVLTGETDVEQAHRDDRFFIARLSGDLYVPESFVFSVDEYRRTLYERPTYAKFVASQAIGRPILFVGTSLAGIEDFFDAFRFPVRPNVTKSYAIVPIGALWEAQQVRFRAKYGVELIGYRVTPGHREVVRLLTTLAKLTGELTAPAGSDQGEGQFAQATLRRIELTNIGAFEHLVLDDIQGGWNVLLGNNGAGKSTILKAIALGMCGDDPEAALCANRLLRSGARSGRIELLVGDVTYQTDLYREGDRVTLRCAQLTPLQKGKSVVLGFPPLRGLSTRDPGGPSSFGGQQPRVADLLPLIRGAADTRLDSLKEWLVNLWVGSRLIGEVPKNEAQRYQRTMDSFYHLLRQFTPGQSIGAGRIERGALWQVFVQTEDGEIPIDAVSQGMSSIFGWVGALLQRMYEIYGDREKPTEQPALVLVDEIDAHLHPEWQQKLVAIVKENLPNVQIFATTHSPLLVAGMKQNELYIARRGRRDASRVRVFRSPIDPEGLRADQVLTSPLFGLQSSRSPKVNEKIDRYVSLLGTKVREDDEEAEFVALRNELSTLLLYGETEIERTAEIREAAESEKKLVELSAAVAAASPELKSKLRDHLAPARRKEPQA
jgi:hypothetical protein